MKKRVLNLFLIGLLLIISLTTVSAISLDDFPENPVLILPSQNESLPVLSSRVSLEENSLFPIFPTEEVVLYAPPSGGGNPIGIPIDGPNALAVGIFILCSLYAGFIYLNRQSGLKKLLVKFKVVKFSLFIMLCFLPTAGFALDLTLTAENGTCAANCKIIASATNTTGDVVYSLKNSTNTISRPVQTSNVFENLEPGEYIVSVYDALNSVPVTAVKAVTTSYQYLAVTSVVGATITDYCVQDGRLTVNFSGGIAPFSYKLEAYPAAYTGVKDFNSSVIPNLPSGSYKISVKDGCNSIAYSAPVTVTSHGAPLSKITLQSVSVASPTISGNSCSSNPVSVTFNSTDKLYDQNSNVISTIYNFKKRLEYPVGSGDYTAWGNMTIPNFDPSNRDVKVEYSHPCTGAITSTVVTIPPDEEMYSADIRLQSTGGGSVTDYCIKPDAGNLYQITVFNGSTFNCHPLNVKVYDTSNPGTNVVDYTTTAGYASRTITIPDLDLEENTSYTIVVTNPTSGYSETFVKITGSKTSPSFNSVDLTTGNIGRGCVTGMSISVSNQFIGTQVIYTIISAPEAEDVGKTAVIVPTKIASTILWTNLSFGTYDIQIDYGCRIEQKKIVRSAPANSFSAELKASISPGDCSGVSYAVTVMMYKGGRVMDIFDRATFVLRGGFFDLYRVLPDGSEEHISKLNPNSGPVYTNLTPGNYLVRFSGNPCYGFVGEKTFTWPENIGKVIIDVNRSGGITCPEQNSAILYVIPIQGAKRYRCKVFGASDATYSAWQTSNQFPGKNIGKYTVQVEGECATISQDLEVYNGNQQFLRIDYPVVNGKVCSGNRVVMRALPIGPVLNYRWYKDDVLIPGAIDDSLVIDNVKMVDSGMYKLIVNNGTCDLISLAPMTVYQTPELPSFELINPPAECGVRPSNMKLQLTFSGASPWEFDFMSNHFSTTNSVYELPLPTPDYGENIYQILNVKDNNGNACVATGFLSASVMIIPPTTTWTAAGTESSWNDPVNWNPGIPGACTYVVIPGELSHYPVITQADNAICDVIHFKHGGEVANTMLLTYNRAEVELTLNANQWYMLSAPLREMYSGDYFHDRSFVTPFPRQNPAVYMMQFQTRNPETQAPCGNGSWSMPFNSMDVSLQSGMGYMAWVDEGTDGGSQYTLDFPKDSVKYTMYTYAGIPYSTIAMPLRINHSRFIYESGNVPNSIAPADGIFTINVQGDESGFSKAIVGNPFMSHLDFGKLVEANSAKIGNSYQIFGGNSYETVLFTGSNILSTVDSNERFIAPMQSFIVTKKTSPALGSLIFNMDMSATRPGVGLRSSGSDVPGVLKFELYRKAVRQSGLLISYQPGALNSFNASEDVLTYFNEADFDPTMETGPAVVYSLLDSKPASIRTIGDLSTPLELGIRSVEKGDLTIKIQGQSDFAGCQWILEDRVAGKKIDLSKESEYTFNNLSGNVEGRFFLRTSSQSAGFENVTTQNISIYADKRTVYASGSLDEPIRSFEVVGLQGQYFEKQMNLNASQASFELPIGQQVVVVKVRTDKTQRTEKIFLK